MVKRDENDVRPDDEASEYREFIHDISSEEERKTFAKQKSSLVGSATRKK